MRATQLGAVVIGIGSCLINASVWAGPIIGGTPVYTQQDPFAAGTWGVNVFSYVYDSNSALPAGFTLDPDRMLFVYLLDGDNAATGSIELFSVGNPFGAKITGVGYSTNILPVGYSKADRQDPFLYGYNGLVGATQYTYADNPAEPFPALDPDEWSLVWFEAEAETWSPGMATMTGAGLSDSHLLPVPGVIPNPGVPAILGVAALFGTRRRRS